MIKATKKANPACHFHRGICHDNKYDYLISSHYYDNCEISRWTNVKPHPHSAKDKTVKKGGKTKSAAQRATPFEKSEMLWEQYKAEDFTRDYTPEATFIIWESKYVI